MASRKLVIGAGAARFNWLPVFVGQRLGLFHDAGLDIEIKRLGAVDKATAAVRTGDIDLAITPPEGAIKDAIVGGDLRIIAGNANTLPLTLIANPAFTSIEALRGARLGTSSLTEGTALYTMEMLRAHGLNYPRDYTFEVVGVHPARWQALQEGRIDAAVQPAPLNMIAIDAGYANLGEVSDYITDIVFSAAIVAARHAEAKRDELTAFLTVLVDATEAIYSGDHDSLLATILADINEADADHAGQAVSYMLSKRTFARGLTIPSVAFAKSVELMQKAQLLNAQEAAMANVVLDPTYLAAIGRDLSSAQ